MQVSFMNKVKLVGMTVAIAALGHQPIMKATTLPSFQPSPIVPTAIMTSAAPRLQSTQIAQSAGAPFVEAAHPTTGSAQIVSEGGQRYLEFDAAFRSAGGPDLFVLLHKEAVPRTYSPDDYVNLGRLEKTDGAQRYAIPADVDIEALKSAVIWCRQFDVTFGYATF